MSEQTSTILFYDIASGPPIRSYAPNPNKARYALNYKKLNYKTQWTDLVDVTTTRRDILQVPPVRKHADGSDYYTFPVLIDNSDPSHPIKIGDSFDIAVYLDKAYPSPRLIPPASIGLMRLFNTKCDQIFSGPSRTFGSIAMCFAHGLPFNPDTAEESKAKFVATNPGVKSWDEMTVYGEERKKVIDGFKVEMDELASYFVRRDEGPYLEGAEVSYADFIVGGWLKMLSIVMPADEWSDIKSWNDGLWERLFNDLQEKYGDER